MSGPATGPAGHAGVRHLVWGLEGRTAMVTGGAGGIGRAVAEAFAEAGCRVAVVDRDGPGAAAAAAALGPGHAAFAADLAEIGALPGLVAAIEARLGPVHALANVAGAIRRTADLFAVEEADWDAQFDVNLKATFFLSRAVARGMIARGQGGAIVTFSSQGWMTGGLAGSVVYSAAKGGVVTLTRGLARSWARHGIRVNAVVPGLVDTPMLRGPGLSEAELAALAAQVPLGRLAQPADLAAATVFLSSDMARYVTGATLNVSGGFLMS